MQAYVLGRVKYHLIALLFIILRFAVSVGLYLFLSLLLRKEQPVYVIIIGFVMMQFVAFCWTEYRLWRHGAGGSSNVRNDRRIPAGAR